MPFWVHNASESVSGICGSCAVDRALCITQQGYYLRVACPDKFRDGEILRDFRNRARTARQAAAPIITDAKFTELDQLVEFSNDFHHDTNPAADTAALYKTQLQTFVGRTLAFVTV